MSVINLVPELAEVAASAASEIEFRARFWSWLDRQRSGPLEPLLSDMVRLWAGLGREPTLEEARKTLARLNGQDWVARAEGVLERFGEAVGVPPRCDVILLAGLRRPEGYSRFDRGRNTVFIGLDHPSNRRPDHFEVVLAHELVHAVRDPVPAVLEDYGGTPEMSHDDFVERHPFREHLVSEALATALSELAYPGRPEPRYVYFDAEAYDWCEAHRREIAERMLRALADQEDYGTFYSEGQVGPGSPDCCDYYFGFHFGRHALSLDAPAELVRLPAAQFLARHLQPFLERFATPAVAVAVPARPSAEAPELTLLPPVSQRFYREWIEDMGAHPERAVEAERLLQQGMLDAGLVMGGEPFEAHGFPLVISREELGYMRWVCESLLQTVERVVALYREDPEVRRFFGLPAHLERLIESEPRYKPAIPIARFDSYWNGRRIRFLELNTNGTAGLCLADRIGPLYAAAEPVRAFLERFRLRAEPVVAAAIETLLEVWRSAGQPRSGRARPRRIAIVDWADVASRPEQEQLRDALQEAGHAAVLAAPADLQWTGSELRAAGQPIDLVYRRLTLNDVSDKPGALEPLFEAAVAGRIVTVGPFAADLAHSKGLFAFLTHERWRGKFSMEERALIDAHVPWTRILRPGRTLRGGQLQELREIALEDRERLVLKPLAGWEGRGVILGIETKPAEWEREVDQRMERGHVLQEYVQPPLRTVFLPRGETLEPVPLLLHLGEFMFGGVLAGFLARASIERVLSPTSHERAMPCFVLDEEEGAHGVDELSHP